MGEFVKKYNLITPEGTRDLLFDECKIRREIENELTDYFKSAGYSEVITPFLEFYDVFNGFPQESMYKLTDSRGRLMVIRPDSTQPIIRLAETRLKDLPRPLRLCYNQTIYRINPKEAGRDDEIAQSGIEIIGANPENDSEAVKMAAAALKKISGDYRFEIGDCSFFDILAEEAGLDEEEKEEIRSLTEKKNFPELKKRFGDGVLARLPKLFGDESVFHEAEKLFKNEALIKVLKKTENIYNDLKKHGAGDKITVDLGLTNKRGYYAGVLFNGYAAGYGKPLLSGGRYCIRGIEGVGFAVNVSAAAKGGQFGK